MGDTGDDVRDRLGGPALLKWHEQFGVDTNVEEYVAKYKIQVDRGMASTKAVYLDTNYWIWLREVETGIGTPAAVVLLSRLRSLVAERKILCVSHLTSMLEIAKQSEGSARVSTLLVDELTERVALAPTAELEALAVANYISAKAGAIPPSSSTQWTSLGQITQSSISGDKVLPATLHNDHRQAILKCAVDALWNTGLSEIFEAFDWDTKNRLSADLDMDVLAEVENRKKTRPHDGNFAKTCQAEFEAAMNQQFELFQSEWLKILGPIGAAALGEKLPLAAKALMRHAVADYQAGSLGNHLAGFVIRTELYSAYECDSGRKISTNDWQDWQHASTALPYCDYFFTEKHLAHQLTNRLRLDTRYQCHVVGSDIEAAIAALDSI
jgi:hypothetical protein